MTVSVVAFLAFGMFLAIWVLEIAALLTTASKAEPKPESKTTGRRTYAEGRPTMPSEVESDVEQSRRLRRLDDCECEYCMEPTLRGGEQDPPSLR
jgi:hypothetical protein